MVRHCLGETFWPVTYQAWSAAMELHLNELLSLSGAWDAWEMSKRKENLRDVISSLNLSAAFWLHPQTVHGEEGKKEKLSPSGGEDKPDNDLQQLNKAPVWQRWIDNTHKHMQTNSRTCPVLCLHKWGRKREKSLTHCCSSKLVWKEKRRERGIAAQQNECGKLCRGKQWALAAEEGGEEDVVTSDVKPRDGAC